MKSLLSQRFEQGILSIHEGVSKKGGTKKLNKVYERIGRLKQKYPSVHTGYDIITNIMQIDEHTFWPIYNIIREVESTFRVLKTDLDLLPIYHKTDQASMEHLLLGILAY